MGVTELGAGFVKLDRRNYLEWVPKIRVRLGTNGLGECIKPAVSVVETAEKVSDVEKVAAKAAAVAVAEKRRVESLKTCAVLLDGMTDTLQIEYLDYVDAELLWSDLKRRYASEGSELQQFAHREYHALKFGSVETYIDSFKRSVNKIKLCAVPMLESLQVSDFLDRLPVQFESLVHAIRSRDDLTLDYCYSRLQSAFDLNPTQYAPIRAHFVAEKSARFGSRVDTRLCYNCGEPGHIRRNCKAVKKQSGEKSANTSVDNYWFVDSCASSHMSPCSSSFILYRPQSGWVTVANGVKLPIVGVGLVAVTSCVEGRSQTLALRDCLHVEGLSESLISVNKLAEDGVSVEFELDKCTIKKGEVVVGEGGIENGVYRLATGSTAMLVTIDVNLAHQRFGHAPVKLLKKMGVKMSGKEHFCEVCVQGKSHRSPFGHHDRSCDAMEVHDVIVGDVAGPFPAPTIDGCVYFLTFVDARSGFVTGYLLKHKSEVAECFKEFEAVSANRHGRTIRVFRSDNGGEFVNAAMSLYLRERGIEHQRTTVYTPQQNGIAERMNRTIANKLRCLLFDAGCGMEMWGEAFNTAIYLINRSINSFSKISAFEAEYGQKETTKQFRRFGCSAYMHVPEEKRVSKLSMRAEKLMFVGYDLMQKGWRLYDPVSRSVIVSRDVTFNEQEMFVGDVERQEIDFVADNDVVAPTTDTLADQDYAASEPSEADSSEYETVSVMSGSDGALSEGESVEELSDVEINAVDEQGAVPDGGIRTRFGRISKKPPVAHTSRSAIVQSNSQVPRSFGQVLKSPMKSEWIAAMDDEMQGLLDNGTWVMVKRTKGMSPIGNKWVFSEKKNADGSVEKLKARLVVLGNQQRRGIDYKETFAPVLHFNSLRTILAVAVEKDLMLHQSDVTRAFLHGDIDESIVMCQPKGYHNGREGEVCLLKRSLYGLKQAPRLWYKKVREKLLVAGFVQSKTDPCVFILNKDGVFHILGLYVDDFIQASSSRASIDRVNAALDKWFTVKQLGSPSKVLGVELRQNLSAGTITFGLEQYTRQAVAEFLDPALFQIGTPFEQNKKLELATEGEEVVDQERFRRAIGALLYMTSRTRPDIASAVRLVSEHVNKPTLRAWGAVARIFQYLKGTIGHSLVYKKGEGCVVGAWSDADWGSCTDTRKSVSGCVVKIGGCTVMWRSKKQPTTALSTTESEYMAVVECAKEVLWLRQLMAEMGVEQSKATVIHDDNVGAIQLANNAVTLARSKHIDIKHHFIRECVEMRSIELVYCRSDENVADIFTKAIPRLKFEAFVTSLGLMKKLTARGAVVESVHGYEETLTAGEVLD